MVAQGLSHLSLLQSSLLPSSGALVLTFKERTEPSVVDVNPLHPSAHTARSSVASPWKQQDILSAVGHGRDGSEHK